MIIEIFVVDRIALKTIPRNPTRPNPRNKYHSAHNHRSDSKEFTALKYHPRIYVEDRPFPIYGSQEKRFVTEFRINN
jgi:hypothetical protein